MFRQQCREYDDAREQYSARGARTVATTQASDALRARLNVITARATAPRASVTSTGGDETGDDAGPAAVRAGADGNGGGASDESRPASTSPAGSGNKGMRIGTALPAVMIKNADTEEKYAQSRLQELVMQGEKERAESTLAEKREVNRVAEAEKAHEFEVEKHRAEVEGFKRKQESEEKQAKFAREMELKTFEQRQEQTKMMTEALRTSAESGKAQMEKMMQVMTVMLKMQEKFMDSVKK